MNKEDQNSKKNVFSKLEEEIIDFWKEGETFKKSVEKPAPKGNYVFYDGPPFITGLPHYATLLPSIAKDIIPRYFTMNGYRVERVWGWDCHGLPAENKVEKNLGLKNKKDIEDMGVKKFVDACREYVSTSSKQWEWYIERIGRWVDMKNAYKTMDSDFMESVMWAFKDLYEKDLIYEGYRTSLHCPRCATPLSKFEITMDAGSYKDVEDDSIVVEFETTEDFSLLAWTTTPWTLPGNMALAVGKNIVYAVVKSSGKKYVLAKDKLNEIFKERNFEVVKEIKGKDLLGISYKPPFTLNSEEIEKSVSVFKVYEADFVSTEEGTGIVHIAPNFGEDDFELGKKEGFPIIEIMDESGVYTERAGEWSGYYFLKANKKALQDLGEKLFLKDRSVHSYPFCYRCDTSLIHKTQKAWYLKIGDVREKMLQSNKGINWVPEHFKEGRFQYNIENAPDWCLSRSRYWGSPVPVWKCKNSGCGSIKVVGSIEEIENLCGKKVKELHRPEIDEIVFTCKECGEEMKRVPEVLDCWFESGSMPFAQVHYPFEKKDEWKKIFPADFIIEYTGQLRGWFYYLHVLSNSLFDSIAFRNVIATGVLAGDDGRKMSKSFGNYPDPKITLDKYGSDALRIYFMSNPIMLGGDTNLSESGIQDALRKNVILLSNILKFYEPFAREKNFFISEKIEEEPSMDNILDRWIMARLNMVIRDIKNNMEKYNLPSVCEAITCFIDDMSTWYIRRSRNRFKGDDQNDAWNALKTSGFVLYQFSKAIAPVLPFLSESVWQKMTGNEFKNKNLSVHLTKYPSFNKEKIDEKLLSDMDTVRKTVSQALKQRAEAGIRVRQPLSVLEVEKGVPEYLFHLIKEEVNVKDVTSGDAIKLHTNITEDLKEEGEQREIIRCIQSLRKEAGLTPKHKIKIFYEGSFDLKNKDNLMKETISEDVSKHKGELLLAQKTLSLSGREVFFGITKS